MRAGKLITLSAVAVLLGGTTLASNLAVGQAAQSGSSMHGSSQHKGSAPKKSLTSHTVLQKTALTTHKRHGIAPSQRGTFAAASARELGEATTGATGPGTRDREAHAVEMMRNIPRVSSVGTSVRIDAVVPRSVRQAAVPLPPEVKRMHPRFRNDRVFKYRDQVVIVNPTTSRIVAIVKAPA
jgi:hypothetical protein